ncbi:MAG: DUF2254 family protein [Euryarchaeota archaeon]|nr:DUF2254 family protein [Euryarchaeota archaeon]
MKITQICALLVAAGVVMGLYGIIVILVCMQGMGGNAKFIGLLGRIRDWGFRYPRIAGLFWYFTLLAVVLGVCHGTFNYLDLHRTDADSARYLLSAMVQAQAAIIAIVITLTLIAVQLTASAYSPRVIDIFKKNPDMWILLVVYGLSMLYGLIVLKMVWGIGGEVVSQDVVWFLGCVPISFEYCVSLAYWLEVFTLVALIPYMRNTIDLLKPENIINRLAIENSIQPIMDIIHGAVMKYDIATTRAGLKTVTDQMIGSIGLDVQKESSNRPIIFKRLDIDVSGPDEESTEEVIEKTDRVEILGDATSQAVESIVNPYFFDFFKRVSRLTISKMDEESTVEVIKNLYNFGRLSSESGLEDATSQVAKSLGFIGKLTAEKGKEFEDVTKQAVRSLRSIGRIAVKNKLDDATSQTAESLGIVGKTAAEKELEGVTIQAVLSLRKVGQIAAKNELEAATGQTAESIGAVGTAAAEKGFERAVLEAAWTLRTVGEIAAEKGLEEGTMEVVLSLIRVGGITAEKRLEDATKIVVRSLGAVGTIAIEKEHKFSVAEEAAWFIGGLTISIEEIPDHDSPKKFMNLYKQRLEELRELRTQKPDRPPHK